MNRNRSLQRLFALPLGLALLASVPAARQVPAQDSREAMWPAPTAEDWARPCLITFQRTFDDALAVSRETRKAILICVNMDGEIASEHYAGIRYREPEKAALYEPYVCVIASVYRHNPRDYDEEGRRILCPRFGSVTCGEHIWIEPVLFEKFFEGQRVAPRHIMVELDGAEVYDVFYAFDTDSVFSAISKGIAERPDVDMPVAREDRPLLERVGSHDIQDRIAIETAYREGARSVRRVLLEETLKHRDVNQVDLLRLALFGFDVELARLARRSLAQSDSESAIDLIGEALRVPMEAAERDALIAALERLGETWPRAATLAVVHRGLGSRSNEVDVEGWSSALAGADSTTSASDRAAIESRLDRRAEVLESRPEDPLARLELAEASLVLAVDPKTSPALTADPKAGSTFARLLFEEAHRNALEAEALGASGWRVDAAVGLGAYYLGELEEAYARAEAAVGAMPAGGYDWISMATMGLFAEARREAIAQALRDEVEWPGEWLTDVHAAYAVLARHPLGTDLHVLTHYDFLRRLGARGQAEQALAEGLARFPDSALLHDRLRGRILAEKGIDGLEATYEARLREEDVPQNLEWFAGYASIVAAEFRRRAGDDEAALAAYDRAITHFERNAQANPDNTGSVDHYIAMALAGCARLAFERGDYEAAVDGLLASFERREDAAATLDGLGISAVGTAQMLLARLTREERAELAARVQAALDGLDPELLVLPAFERGGPRRPDAGRRGGRGRPPQGDR